MLTGVNVLVVQGDAALSKLIGKALTRHHAEVRFADTSQQGLECVREESPDVIICDYILTPGGIGQFEASVKQLHPQVKLLLCSGVHDYTRIGDGFLRKPFELSELVNSVAALAKA